MHRAYQKKLLDLVRFDFSPHDENPSLVTISAVLGGQTIGYAKTSLESREAHLTNLRVEPRFRSNGVGRTLVAQFIRLGHKNGYETLVLDACPFEDVSLTLAELIKFYESMGFKLKPLSTNIMSLDI